MNREELRAEIARKNVSKAQIARELGISTSGLWLKMTGEREFKETEIKALVRVLDLTPADVDRIFLQ